MTSEAPEECDNPLHARDHKPITESQGITLRLSGTARIRRCSTEVSPEHPSLAP